MKKFFVLMMVAAMSIACGSVVDKAKDYDKQIEELTKQYEAALEANDEKKADEIEKELEKLEKEMEEWMNSLSEEEKAEILKAALEE